MIKKWFSLFGLIIVFSLSGIAQDSSSVLLTVGDEKVDAEEFWSIYKKNSNINLQGEKTSLKEYLELYINFKLKVKEAKDAKMDTATPFLKELEGYRQQLAKPYLVIEEVNDETVRQLYDRMLINVRASHILFRLAENASPADTLAVFQKAFQTRQAILDGTYSFADAAVKFSEDPSARDTNMGNGRPMRKGNQGDLGYFGVFDMVFPFEEAVFNLQKGEISMPVRTRFGYHLIFLTDKIPAIGQVRAAHIFIKNSSSSEADSAKMWIDTLYAQIQNGKTFEEIVRQHSDDKGSSKKGGELPWFGANRMVPEFIAAISKMKVGDISAPVKTSFGWHIIKFLDQKPVEDFEKVKEEIKEKLKRDVRSHKGELAKIAQIKNEEHFLEFPENLHEAFSAVNANFYSSKFVIESLSNYTKPIFSIHDREYSQYDFLMHLDKQKESVMPDNFPVFLEKRYQEYVNQNCLNYEEEHLEEKYSEFRLIMNEYREGILLFDLMDKKVWSAASKDTLGLEQFFAKNQNKYKWKKRAQLSVFHLNDKSYSDSVQDLLFLGKTDEEILNEFSGDSLNPVRLENITIEKGDKPEYDAFKWKKSAFYSLMDENGEVEAIIAFRDILKPTLKKLSETRGMAIANYQTHLEKEWIAELKKRYQVKVDKHVLRTLKERDKE
ncbi:MAG: peptidylprolyl isomerase [Bacteroidales bacterium]|nr:peptidylprolyl isomerase [Bacteroidales bacterium]